MTIVEDSYVAGPSDRPLRGRTIGEELDLAAELYGARDAIVARHQDTRLTYRELLVVSATVGRSLLDLGVAAGDRVGVWSSNRWEWAAAQYGTAQAGAILVNVNPAYRSDELTYALIRSGISVLIAARAFRTRDYLGLLDDVRGDAPDLRHIVLLDPLDHATGDGTPDWAEPWSSFLDRADRIDAGAFLDRQRSLDRDDPINIQFTSGTTGRPKGATLTHHQVLNNARFVGERLRLSSADRICVPVPYYHCFGMVLGNLTALTHGAAVVLPSEAFDAGATLEAVDAEACSVLHGVPTMFIAELEHPDLDRYDLSTLRTGVMAGAPCPIELMRKVVSRLHVPEITIGYGMTETSPISFQSMPDDELEHRVSTVGAVHPWVEAKVIDPTTGSTVPRGVVGEFCSRGYLVMRGYWEDPAATRDAVDDAGWMHSGDLAVMDDDGSIRIVGRSKDMIIRGGENVYPREIEEFLFTHPAIADVQVVGVPDPKYGEEICAWVVLHGGMDLTEEELRDYCRGKIATYKIPRFIVFVDGFPTTVTGKVQKFRMRELSLERLGREPVTAP